MPPVCRIGPAYPDYCLLICLQNAEKNIMETFSWTFCLKFEVNVLLVSFYYNYKDFYHFWIFGCVTFLSFHLFVFKAQYLLLKNSNKCRIFTVTILYHHFIWKKYLTFPISNRNKSDDKKVTDYRNVHNPAYVFWTCP